MKLLAHLFKLPFMGHNATSKTISQSMKMSMSHWSKLPLAPPDKILGLNEMCLKSTHPNKVNLGVGAYRDEKGKPLVLESVRQAKNSLNAPVFTNEKGELIVSDPGHEYTTIAGVQSFVNLSVQFAYGVDAKVIANGQIAAVQTLSGTGACRLFGEFIAKFIQNSDNKDVYLPDPTWGNHLAIMRSSGLKPVTYRYYDPVTKGLDFNGFLEDVVKAPERSVFLIHACAHNPTGCDPTHAQWDKLSEAIRARNHIVFFDCAYQGFASGDSEADAYAIRKFVDDGHYIMLAQSFAKNFGLYGERVGALSVVTSSAEESERVKSQLQLLIRPMYSSPPLYGARLVAAVLGKETLKQQWVVDCKEMADRIKQMRALLRKELEQLGSPLSWRHMTDQIGMFCYSGLTTAQVLQLREDHAIFCTDDGRISMAGVNKGNVRYIAEAIHKCTTNSSAKK